MVRFYRIEKKGYESEDYKEKEEIVFSNSFFVTKYFLEKTKENLNKGEKMKVIKMFRNGKVITVLEVTKRDLLELKEKYSYISVSEADIKNLENFDDNKIVGIISGDIHCINDTCENPDCWFVFQPEKHGYKKLDESFRCDFGDAIRLLKQGFKVARDGWNGKGMFLFLVPGSTFKVSRPPLLGIYEEGTEVTYQPHIDMKTAQDTVVPWLASQSDVLAEDWCIVE